MRAGLNPRYHPAIAPKPSQMSSSQKKVTIYQVAARAGVAISTVSRVLNDSPNVSEETRRKVEQAIEELHFRPQVSARNLASRKPQIIAIAVPSFTTPFYTEVLKGIKDRISEKELDIIIYNTGSTSPADALESFFDRGTADALITISIDLTDTIRKQIEASGIPTVMIGSSHPDFDYFELDNLRGGMLAADHLVAQGYRSLGMILPAVETHAARQRKEGFLRGLEKHGIPLEETFRVKGETTKHAGFTEETGFEAIQRYHKLGRFPDAVFCLDDTQAIGALHALNQLGMSVPDDIALMGYGDIKLARYLDLSTIDQQMQKVGMMATDRMLELIRRPDSERVQKVIEPLLVKRKSTDKVQ